VASKRWESDRVLGLETVWYEVGATGRAQRCLFQTNGGWLNTPKDERDEKMEEEEGPSTVLTMRLRLCCEECMKSTAVRASSLVFASGPTPGAMGGDVLLAREFYSTSLYYLR
jgi:hypothetical protein